MYVTLISCAITGVITLVVCLINNAVALKKNSDDSKQHVQDQISTIKKDINESMNDMTVRLEKMIANQESSQISIKKDIDHLTYCLMELDKKVEKHNNVVERTYNLERSAELLQEKIEQNTERLNDKIKVANARIADLEHTNEKK